MLKNECFAEINDSKDLCQRIIASWLQNHKPDTLHNIRNILKQNVYYYKEVKARLQNFLYQRFYQ